MNSSTVSYRTSIRNISDYSPFGVQLDGRTVSGDSYRYAFNGMEKDDELKGAGNSYDFGARMLDSRVGRWLTIDDKSSKFPHESTYLFVSNCPLIFKDPDGKEKIVVAGSENRTWKLTFALPAMKAVKELKSGAGDEQVTLLLFKAGYSDGQLKRIQKYVNKKGVVSQVLTSSDDLVNYINNKSITTKQSGRKDDPISNLSMYAHGLVGNIAFGYHQESSIETKYAFGSDQVNALKAEAFKNGSVINSYACRTGAGKDVGESGADTDPEKSLAQQMANHLGVTVYAYQKRTDYGNILPEDKRNIIERYLYPDKTYDNNGGTWDTDKSLDKVNYPMEGDTPTGSPGVTKFQKNKQPVVVN